MRLCAYCGRYGGQQIGALLARPVSQIVALARDVGELLDDEGAAQVATRPRG